MEETTTTVVIMIIITLRARVCSIAVVSDDPADSTGVYLVFLLFRGPGRPETAEHDDDS